MPSKSAFWIILVEMPVDRRLHQISLSGTLVDLRFFGEGDIYGQEWLVSDGLVVDSLLE